MAGERVRQQFLRFGWLIPAALPLAQVLGRSVVELAFLIFLLWATMSFMHGRAQVHRTALLLYAILVLSFALSVPGAPDMAKAAEKWLKFTLYTSVFYVALAVLRERPEQLDRFMRALAGTGIVLLVVLFVWLPFQLAQPGFSPSADLKEDNLPFLLPFMLYAAHSLKSARWRYVLMLALGAAVVFYVAFSQGRAALLGLIIAVFTYTLLSLGWRRRTAILVGTVVLALGIGLSLGTFFRSVQDGGSLTDVLDRFTTQRTQFWREAVRHPPKSVITGAGLGSSALYDERGEPILAMLEGRPITALHNLFMDVWYQTGLLGIGAMLALLGYVFGLSLIRRSGLDAGAASRQGVLLAAALAILAAAMFGLSYSSKPVSIYLFLLLAALLHVALDVVPVQRQAPENSS